MAKVLFQAMNSNLFRAIFIGYLYEIAQKHRVVLLVESIDEKTKNVLADKSLFPGLENIIFFESAFYGDIFRKNYRLSRTLKNAVRDFKPDVVIAHSDFWPADMYVFRFAKRAGAVTVAMQAGFKIAGERKLYQWSCLVNSYLHMPRFLPLSMRLFLVKLKKHAGHFLYYWILPLTAGEKPFWGKTSFAFWDEASGLRDADYATVFSKRDYNLLVQDGVKPEKVFVLGHPFEHPDTKEFFKKTYFVGKTNQEEYKTLTVMWPDETIGFREKNHSLISSQEMQKNRAVIVGILAAKLSGWKIFIKAHPAVQTVEAAQKLIGPVPANVSIADPSDPADRYIENSRVIVGIPPASTTLFSASRQSPEKIALFVNLYDELLGDAYKKYEGVEYIDTKEKFVGLLNAVRQGRCQKRSQDAANLDFSNTNDFLEHVGVS